MRTKGTCGAKLASNDPAAERSSDAYLLAENCGALPYGTLPAPLAPSPRETSNWGFDGLSNGPVKPYNPCQNGIVIPTNSFACVFEGCFHSPKQDHFRAASIVLLLMPRLPLAIRRLIMAVIVLASKCQPRRAVSHILQKQMKGAPTCAHPDSTAAVMLPIPSCFPKAAIEHIGPATIGRAMLFITGVAMFIIVIVDSVARYFGGHSVAFSMLCSSGGRPATTGAHYAY